MSDNRIPPARVVKGGEAVGVDTEQMWKPDEHVPVTRDDVAEGNPRVIVEQLRHLTREMRDGFDGIGRALVALTHINDKLDVVIDRQNVLERRQDDLDRRVSALENTTLSQRAGTRAPVRRR